MKHTALASLYSLAIADLTSVEQFARLLVLLAPLIVGVIQALRRPPRREPKARKVKTSGTRLLPVVALFVACLGCGGCLFERPSAVVRALGSDTNSVTIHVTTVYGQLDVRRNAPAP